MYYVQLKQDISKEGGDRSSVVLLQYFLQSRYAVV